MRGQPSVRRRAGRLEAVRQRAEVFALAHRLAAELGLTAEELLAEAVGLRRRMQVAGAFTRDHQVAFVATELGIPAAELRTELAWIGAVM